MRIAIISDTHFGDPDCVLDPKPLVQDKEEVDTKKQKRNDNALASFFNGLGGEDIHYLVMIGDILDFSIASYKDAYRSAKNFFQEVVTNGKIKKILYIPGNHDADVWHIVEHQTNVINKIADNKDVEEFRHSVPAIIDDRSGAGCLQLYGVSPSPISNNDSPDYSKQRLFMDKLTDGQVPIYFAYPNAYLVTDDKTVLLTHGQYFDPFWSVSGEIVMNIAKDDIYKYTKASFLNIRRMMECNFPLTRLSCTGIGQAGALSELALDIQKEIKDGKMERVSRYIERIKKWLDEQIKFNNWNPLGLIKEVFSDQCLEGAFDKLMDELSKLKNPTGARHNEKYLIESLHRIRNFFDASIHERDEINNNPAWKGGKVPSPSWVVFGHTHDSIPYGKPEQHILMPGQSPVRFCNTGGWLDEPNCNGEIFIYDTQSGFSSVPVTWDSLHQ